MEGGCQAVVQSRLDAFNRPDDGEMRNCSNGQAIGNRFGRIARVFGPAIDELALLSIPDILSQYI